MDATGAGGTSSYQHVQPSRTSNVPYVSTPLYDPNPEASLYAWSKSYYIHDANDNPYWIVEQTYDVNPTEYYYYKYKPIEDGRPNDLLEENWIKFKPGLQIAAEQNNQIADAGGIAAFSLMAVGTAAVTLASAPAVIGGVSINAANTTTKLLGTARDNLLNVVKNPKLRNIVNDLYRPGAKVGSGSSMDAFRLELLTGGTVGGKTHATKLLNYRTALQRVWSNRAKLSAGDRQITKQLLRDIQNALSGH
jgi:hypothetical protein